MSGKANDALAEALLARGERLTSAVLTQMYRDPFWHARFGARADEHGRKDGLFHLQYLAQSLRADDPEVMNAYARWLRVLLVSRGMCTRHLVENLELLAEAVRAEALPEGERAVAVFEGAARSLRYTEGVPAALLSERDALAESTVSRLGSLVPWEAEGRQRYVLLAREAVEYLADSLDAVRPDLFAQWAAFAFPFAEANGVPPMHLHALLEALRRTLGARQLIEAAGVVEAALSHPAERVPLRSRGR